MTIRLSSRSGRRNLQFNIFHVSAPLCSSIPSTQVMQKEKCRLNARRFCSGTKSKMTFCKFRCRTPPQTEPEAGLLNVIVRKENFEQDKHEIITWTDAKAGTFKWLQLSWGKIKIILLSYTYHCKYSQTSYPMTRVSQQDEVLCWRETPPWRSTPLRIGKFSRQSLCCSLRK